MRVETRLNPKYLRVWTKCLWKNERKHFREKQLICKCSVISVSESELLLWIRMLSALSIIWVGNQWWTYSSAVKGCRYVSDLLCAAPPTWFRSWYSNEWKRDRMRLKFIPVPDHLYSPTVAVVQLSTIRLGSQQQMGFLHSMSMRAYCTVSNFHFLLLLSNVPRGVIIGFTSVCIYL